MNLLSRWACRFKPWLQCDVLVAVPFESPTGKATHLVWCRCAQNGSNCTKLLSWGRCELLSHDIDVRHVWYADVAWQ
jgi:hypothetical protein